jgi:hypothetical protein
MPKKQPDSHPSGAHHTAADFLENLPSLDPDTFSEEIPSLPDPPTVRFEIVDMPLASPPPPSKPEPPGGAAPGAQPPAPPPAPPGGDGKKGGWMQLILSSVISGVVMGIMGEIFADPDPDNDFFS